LIHIQSIDASKLDAQKDKALAITGNQTPLTHFTGEELQVKFLAGSEENSLKY
jgi:hypothetical protein